MLSAFSLLKKKERTSPGLIFLNILPCGLEVEREWISLDATPIVLPIDARLSPGFTERRFSRVRVLSELALAEFRGSIIGNVKGIELLIIGPFGPCFALKSEE